MGDRSSDTVDAEVVKAEAVTGTKQNKYVLEYENDDNDPATIDTVPVMTERHLRLGENVFVDTDDRANSSVRSTIGCSRLPWCCGCLRSD